MNDAVRGHYESHPYPARDPKDEAKRLVMGSPSHILEINHYLFAGALDFSRPFRALIAGGGTGDAAIMLAQQLADSGGPGRVDYLDLSSAARAIVEARAEARGLTNLSFHNGSILDLPEGDLGPYDYIDCCGVLHHMPDPAAGLAALKAVLTPEGGMGLMLYGELGRRGVYEVQAMLKRLEGEERFPQRIERAQRLLAALPPTNWLKRNPFLGDHKRGDAELADLLLHPLDRPFRVAEVGALLETAELQLVSFIEPARYDPRSYLKDPRLLKEAAKLGSLERAAFAEELAGNIKTHIFYATAQAGDTQARPEGPEMIPCLKTYDGSELATACRRNLKLNAEFDGLPLSFALPRLAPLILERIDNARSLGEIHRSLSELDKKLSWAAFLKQFQGLYQAVQGLNHLFLKRP